jgi:hypothetical protein
VERYKQWRLDTNRPKNVSDCEYCGRRKRHHGGGNPHTMPERGLAVRLFDDGGRGPKICCFRSGFGKLFPGNDGKEHLAPNFML